MANIITAIINLIRSPKYELMEYSRNHNRANAVGDAMEEYVKDLFSDTVSEKDEKVRMSKISNTFSYLGNTHNPPDAILACGDAIEVKKIESDDSILPLNSSYPKQRLYSDSPMITESCRCCEDWNVKDIIYAVGVTDEERVTSLALVYGTEYCAVKEVYERIKGTIREGVNSIPGVRFAETAELGRVNKVDPLGITNLRIRGMWTIDNPFKVFSYIYKKNPRDRFSFMAVIGKEKYESFENRAELEGMCDIYKELKIEDSQVKNPDNPAKLIDVKLVTFSVK